MRTNGDVEVPLSEPPSSERDTPFMYVPRGTTLARTYTHTLATSRSAAVEQGGGERKTHVRIDPFCGSHALLSHGKVLARTFEMGQVRGITPGRVNPLTSAVGRQAVGAVSCSRLPLSPPSRRGETIPFGSGLAGRLTRWVKA
ncbi:hypothetical protein MTO96_013251 [Rhipicephalus appendiculatus]